jgi:hypothetical protein
MRGAVPPQQKVFMTLCLIKHMENYLSTYLSIYGSTALCWLLAAFFTFLMFFTQSVGFLGRGISLSQGRHLHTE